MKKIFIEVMSVLIIAIIAASVFNMASSSRINITKRYKNTENVNSKYNADNIDIEIFRFYLEKEGSIILDARVESDFRSGHIPGAHSFSVTDFDTVFRERGALLKLGKTILIYCSGPTCEDSHQLAEKLSARGIKEIFVFSGGMEKWIEAGLETERDGI